MWKSSWPSTRGILPQEPKNNGSLSPPRRSFMSPRKLRTRQKGGGGGGLFFENVGIGEDLMDIRTRDLPSLSVVEASFGSSKFSGSSCRGLLSSVLGDADNNMDLSSTLVLYPDFLCMRPNDNYPRPWLKKSKNGNTTYTKDKKGNTTYTMKPISRDLMYIPPKDLVSEPLLPNY